VGQTIGFYGLPILYPAGQPHMTFYRRRLPHWFPDDAAVFVTWRLYDSKPSSSEGDCLDGPVWLRDCRVANAVASALRYGEEVRRLYHLYAWVIMPNHVHAILQPLGEMSGIMRWLKGRTARRANRILGRTGATFWQDESFDHWIRSAAELQDLIAYVEGNPVKAGLAGAPCQWPWSSAGRKADDKNRSSAPRI
jgi:putative transposase